MCDVDEEALDYKHTRAPDPFLEIDGNFILRRVTADTRKVERTFDFDRKLGRKLLRAMGFHAASADVVPDILRDLEERRDGWLGECAKARQPWKKTSRPGSNSK